MYDPGAAKRDVITLYSAIISQAVKDYQQGFNRGSVMKFLNSDWGRSILDVLGLDHDIMVAKLREGVK